jgi:apolipoprotein N-acyltransferase
MRLVKGAAALASGLLLWAAFPPKAQGDSAWLALVPLLLLVRVVAPRAAFGWAWLSGLVFWSLTLSWFPAIIKNGGPWALVVLGQVALAAWCALFLGVFASVSARVWRWAGGAPGWRRVLVVLLADPLVWVGTEYVRGRLFSGFAWNFLGVSQVANTSVIQVASVGGVYAVSALVLLVNGAAASIAARAAEPLLARLSGREARARPAAWWGRVWQSAEGLLPFAAVMACWAWGVGRVDAWRRAEEAGMDTWRVALVQPNSPCVFEINDDAARVELRGRLLDQTRLAGAARPDLTVWPETALLGAVPYEAETMRVAREGAAAAGGPLLTGALEIERVAPGPAAPSGLCFYNAAWLFSATGEAMGRYRKQHLVPFGEYVPLDKTIPWLQRLAPTGVSCTSGRGPGVITITKGPGRELRLGPLICFEDTVPALSRAAVRAGAGLLVLMTNDAWFNGSIEPVQHLSQSVFRAVENGVPLVRAANSGVSCVVDPVGRVTRLESQSDGAVADFTGFLVTPVAVPARPLPAPYTRFGDGLLAVPGALLAAGLALGGLWADARGRKASG